MMRLKYIAAVCVWAGCLSVTRAAETPVTVAELQAEFPADLGPSTIDVSSYPVYQQQSYVIFTHACSICHTPARAINAPTTSAVQWGHYVSQMHLRAQEQLLSKEDMKRLVDFLAYDSKIRKIQHKDTFDAQQEHLNTRFESVLKEKNKTPQPKK